MKILHLITCRSGMFARAWANKIRLYCDLHSIIPTSKMVATLLWFPEIPALVAWSSGEISVYHLTWTIWWLTSRFKPPHFCGSGWRYLQNNPASDRPGHWFQASFRAREDFATIHRMCKCMFGINPPLPSTGFFGQETANPRWKWAVSECWKWLDASTKIPRWRLATNHHGRFTMISRYDFTNKIGMITDNGWYGGVLNSGKMTWTCFSYMLLVFFRLSIEFLPVSFLELLSPYPVKTDPAMVIYQQGLRVHAKRPIKTVPKKNKVSM